MKDLPTFNKRCAWFAFIQRIRTPQQTLETLQSATCLAFSPKSVHVSFSCAFPESLCSSTIAIRCRLKKKLPHILLLTKVRHVQLSRIYALSELHVWWSDSVRNAFHPHPFWHLIVGDTHTHSICNVLNPTFTPASCFAEVRERSQGSYSTICSIFPMFPWKD